MPDMTLRSYLYCESIENFVTVKGSKEYIVRHGPSVFGPTQYDWHCQCDGFKYRGRCKHIVQAKEEYCGWDQFIDDIEPAYVEDGARACPKCGGPLKSRLVAV